MILWLSFSFNLSTTNHYDCRKPRSCDLGFLQFAVVPKLLDKAEADRESHSKAKAVAVAKRLVRESIAIQVLPNSQATIMVPDVVFEIYEQHFRDVGENTFVYNENALKKVVSELSKLSSPTPFTTKQGKRK